MSNRNLVGTRADGSWITERSSCTSAGTVSEQCNKRIGDTHCLLEESLRPLYPLRFPFLAGAGGLLGRGVLPIGSKSPGVVTFTTVFCNAHSTLSSMTMKLSRCESVAMSVLMTSAHQVRHTTMITNPLLPPLQRSFHSLEDGGSPW